MHFDFVDPLLCEAQGWAKPSATRMTLIRVAKK
jgi:hypothetical protein